MMIRAFNKKDMIPVMDIWLKTVIDAHDFIDAFYWNNAYNTVKEKYLFKSKTFVFEADDVIAGFLSVISDDTIGALFIDQHYQRQGIGTKLMNHVKQKFNLLSVSVYQKNLNALAFYKKNGFVYQYSQNDLNTNEREDVLVFKVDVH